MGCGSRPYKPLATKRTGGKAFMGRPPPRNHRLPMAQAISSAPAPAQAAPASGASGTGSGTSAAVRCAHHTSTAGSTVQKAAP